MRILNASVNNTLIYQLLHLVLQLINTQSTKCVYIVNNPLIILILFMDQRVNFSEKIRKIFVPDGR